MDNGLRIVQGNTFATAIEIHAVDATGQPIVDWSLQDSTDLRVWYVFAGREQDITTWQIDDGKLVIVWLANMQRVGTYDIFCAGKYNGADWRNAMQYQFSIVRFNHEANIPANVVILDGIYQLSAELQIITQFAGGGGGTPSQTLPLMDGEAQVGTENAYARGDHRHPSDTSKQDVIADLDAIRSGAQKGATAYQLPTNGIPKNDLSSAVQTSLGKADTALQTETEPLFTASPAHGITSEDISNWDAKSDFSGNYNDLTNKPTIPTALSQLSQDTTHRVVTDSEKTTWNNKSDFSGSYNDLTNKPTIPAAQVNSDWNASSGVAQILNKPTIPAAQVNSDWNASSGVAQILNKPTIPSALSQMTEDTTHRVVTDAEKATWNNKQDALVSGTNIKTINNESLLGSGNIDTQGGGDSCLIYDIDITNMSDGYLGIDSAAPYIAIDTAYQAGKVVYVRLTNGDTPNEPVIPLQVIEGNGDWYEFRQYVSSNAEPDYVFTYAVIVYDDAVDVYYAEAQLLQPTPIINHGTSDTTFAVTPNIMHIWGTVGSLTLTLATPTDNTIVNLYMFEFTSGSTATNLSLPSTVTWEKGVTFAVEANTRYEITIQNNGAKFSAFATA